MPDNVISAELSDADRTAIMTALDDVNNLMPFLVDLTPDQRRRLNKLGPASLQFARDALTVAQQHEDIIPRGFDVDEFEKDLVLTEQLDVILLKLNSLREHVDDTRRLVGAEAMRGARQVYRYVQATPHGQALDAAAQQLGMRFRRRNNNGNGSAGNGGASQ